MRKGSSILELVFAIVTLGIALTSLPMLFTQVKHATNFSLIEEGAGMSAATVDAVMTFPWDEVLTEEKYSSYVLETDSGSDLFKKKSSGLRGERSAFSPTRRYSTTESLHASSIGPDGGTNDVDDFNGKNIEMTVPDETDRNDYSTKEVKVHIDVSYWSFNYSISGYTMSASPAGPSSSSTNAKKITATFSAEGRPTVSLYGYSFNTGGYHVETKVF